LNSKMNDELLYRQVESLLDIGIALSAEKKHNRLLERIVSEARSITNCDAGTLYLIEDNTLKFTIIQNESKNIFLNDPKEINLPPVPMAKGNVSSYVAMTGRSINIQDVYTYPDFDFSGPRNYDKITGYRTKSMLVVPMENHESEVIGVLQLINSLEADKKEIRPFPCYYEKVIESLSSQAAIALTNMSLIKDIENLFSSFVEAIAAAIDQRSPYNVNHTRRVVKISRAMAEAVNKSGHWGEQIFDEERIEQLMMAGWLHDIGKITTPLTVMNKATRMEGKISLVLQRLDFIGELEKAGSLKKQLHFAREGNFQDLEIEEQILADKIMKLEEIRELVISCDNPAKFINEDISSMLREAAQNTYLDQGGILQPYITPEELENLCICKGTLTEDERKTMEDHVVVTSRMLEKIPFISKFKNVNIFASMHHELLDGTGYPQGLSGEEIPLEVRILAIADIFDALTAADRPYKKALPNEVAISIVESMAKEGKLDGQLVGLLKEYEVWNDID
jgi:HD-GYP domain-containing protein (c-di-GMP phosphodiesterase class II)